MAPEKITTHKHLERSNSSNAKPVLAELEKIIKLSHPDRVLFSPMVMAKELEGESPDLVIQAITRGSRGEFGEVFRIDGLAILTWVSKQKKENEQNIALRKQMGFMD